MSDSATYSVIVKGDIQAGSSLPQVHEAFAILFKMTPEKASAFLKTPRAIKKEVDLKTATAYRTRLEGIGLVVTLEKNEPEKQEPPAASGGFSLALEPIEEETPEVPPEPVGNTMTCPKCALEQDKAEECAGCGVFIHKVASQQPATLGATSSATKPAISEPKASEAESPFPMEDNLNTKVLMAAAGAAFLGAMLWHFIAVAISYELGLIAWLIGGGIGFTTAMVGGRGDVSGFVCGALVVISILGGKYMTASTLYDEAVEIMSSALAQDEIRYAYEEELSDAEAFVEQVLDEQSLRAFMVDYGYTDEIEPEDISFEEIEGFKAFSEPRLDSFAYNKPTFEEWAERTIDTATEEVTAMDIFKENLGFMDIIFLLLGVGTAFRLGRGGALS